MKQAIEKVLTTMDLTPVLVDIGASIKPPEIWEVLAPHSIYVGFDPDLRDLQEVDEGVFKKAYVVNKAITDGESGGETDFYFTSSPYCSSVLPPHTEALQEWFFAPLFVEESRGKAGAVTLNDVADELELESIDWVKTDSQGTDLRVLTVLSKRRWGGLLATDIEPGLIDAYMGEDLFVDAHKHLVSEGFWLSDMTLGQCVRLRRSTFEAVRSRLGGMSADKAESVIRTSPGWTNARYLKTLAATEGLDEGKLALLWVFALVDNQLGYALDIGVEYEKRFGRDAVSDLLIEAPAAQIASMG